MAEIHIKNSSTGIKIYKKKLSVREYSLKILSRNKDPKQSANDHENDVIQTEELDINKTKSDTVENQTTTIKSTDKNISEDISGTQKCIEDTLLKNNVHLTNSQFLRNNMPKSLVYDEVYILHDNTSLCKDETSALEITCYEDGSYRLFMTLDIDQFCTILPVYISCKNKQLLNFLSDLQIPEITSTILLNCWDIEYCIKYLKSNHKDYVEKVFKFSSAFNQLKLDFVLEKLDDSSIRSLIEKCITGLAEIPGKCVLRIISNNFIEDGSSQNPQDIDTNASESLSQYLEKFGISDFENCISNIISTIKQRPPNFDNPLLRKFLSEEISNNGSDNFHDKMLATVFFDNFRKRTANYENVDSLVNGKSIKYDSRSTATDSTESMHLFSIIVDNDLEFISDSFNNISNYQKLLMIFECFTNTQEKARLVLNSSLLTLMCCTDLFNTFFEQFSEVFNEIIDFEANDEYVFDFTSDQNQISSLLKANNDSSSFEIASNHEKIAIPASLTTPDSSCTQNSGVKDNNTSLSPDLLYTNKKICWIKALKGLLFKLNEISNANFSKGIMCPQKLYRNLKNLLLNYHYVEKYNVRLHRNKLETLRIFKRLSTQNAASLSSKLESFKDPRVILESLIQQVSKTDNMIPVCVSLVHKLSPFYVECIFYGLLVQIFELFAEKECLKMEQSFSGNSSPNKDSEKFRFADVFINLVNTIQNLDNKDNIMHTHGGLSEQFESRMEQFIKNIFSGFSDVSIPKIYQSARILHDFLPSNVDKRHKNNICFENSCLRRSLDIRKQYTQDQFHHYNNQNFIKGTKNVDKGIPHDQNTKLDFSHRNKPQEAVKHKKVCNTQSSDENHDPHITTSLDTALSTSISPRLFFKQFDCSLLKFFVKCFIEPRQICDDKYNLVDFFLNRKAAKGDFRPIYLFEKCWNNKDCLNTHIFHLYQSYNTVFKAPDINLADRYDIAERLLTKFMELLDKDKKEEFMRKELLEGIDHCLVLDELQFFLPIEIKVAASKVSVEVIDILVIDFVNILQEKVSKPLCDLDLLDELKQCESLENSSKVTSPKRKIAISKKYYQNTPCNQKNMPNSFDLGFYYESLEDLSPSMNDSGSRPSMSLEKHYSDSSPSSNNLQNIDGAEPSKTETTISTKQNLELRCSIKGFTNTFDDIFDSRTFYNLILLIKYRIDYFSNPLFQILCDLQQFSENLRFKSCISILKIRQRSVNFTQNPEKIINKTSIENVKALMETKKNNVHLSSNNTHEICNSKELKKPSSSTLDHKSPARNPSRNSEDRGSRIVLDQPEKTNSSMYDVVKNPQKTAKVANGASRSKEEHNRSGHTQLKASQMEWKKQTPEERRKRFASQKK